MKVTDLKKFFICVIVLFLYCTVVFSEDYKYIFSTDTSRNLSFRRSYHDSHSAVKYFREFSFNKRKSFLPGKKKKDQDFLFAPNDTSSEDKNTSENFPSQFELNQLHDKFLSEAINATASSIIAPQISSSTENLQDDNNITSNPQLTSISVASASAEK
ncbi:MAG: hypothetical protein HQM10_10555 [Candidatus Riflebacteria bacterium]|nr:hypothetical protein [Candidatus Riflebacteria bacterium]